MNKKEIIKARMPVMETNAQNGDPEKIKELQLQWMQHKLTFEEYLKAIRESGGEVKFGDIHVTGPKDAQLKIENLLKTYQEGKITMHTMRRLIEDLGAETHFWDWELDSNPLYRPEESKIGFTWNPYHNKKGIFMQNVTKRVIIKMVDFIYKSILKYDKHSYAFSDPRLLLLKSFVSDFTEQNLKVKYKRDLAAKLIDIGLFMMKEDVYYRVLGLEMINKLPRNIKVYDDEMGFFMKEVPK